MSGSDLSNYRHKDWNVEFSYPPEWSVEAREEEEQYPLTITPDRVADASVQFRMLEAEDSSVEALLEKLSVEFPEAFDQFEVLNKGIQETKKKEKRGVLVFKHSTAETLTISQEVIYPLQDGRFLFFRASSPEPSWEELQAHFAKIMRSVHYFNPEEIEIVFGEPEAPKIGENDVEVTFHEEALPLDLSGKVSEKEGEKKVQNNPAENKPIAVEFGNDDTFADPDLKESRDFEEFAESFNRSWRMCARKEDLIAICEEESIAKVLWAAAGSHALHWIMEKCVGLGGKSPKQCLAHPAGREELKAFLLRLDDEATNLIEISKSVPVLEEDNHEAMANFRKLLDVQDAYRSSVEWSREFSRLVSQLIFYVPERAYTSDSNGYPYFMAFTELTPQLGNARRMRVVEFVEEVTSYASGLIIDPHRQAPARGVSYSFGSMWEFREVGRILEPEPQPQNGAPAHIEEPLNGNLFPEYARSAIREFLEESVGFKEPKAYQQRNLNDDSEITLLINLVDYSIDPEVLHPIMNALYWFIRPGFNVGCCVSTEETRDLLSPL